MVDKITERDIAYTRIILVTSLVLAVAGAIIFLFMPEIDLVLGGLFYNSDTGFLLNQYQSAEIIRKAIIYAYAFWYGAIVFLMVLAFHDLRKTPSIKKQYGLLKLDLKQLIYLFITSLAGPLLVANVILKNNWGRARPRHIAEFNGSQDFTPPLLITDQCQTNCSFVSGEPSSMFMIFFALSFIMPRHRKLLLTLAVTLGFLSGLMRMGQGGHFFSDVVFAGLFMAITAAVTYWVMFVFRKRSVM